VARSSTVKKSTRVAAIILVCSGAAWSGFAAEQSQVVTVDLPAETARLASGPNVASAQVCMVCHSVDYIYVQPPLTSEQWRGEVLKMKNTFGAPIADTDIDKIVSYLVSQNSKQ
jgi:sulfite dehydrogenase (cytochrome) subunit B